MEDFIDFVVGFLAVFWLCFAWILRYFNANKWRKYGFCAKKDFAKEVYFGD